MDMRWAWDLHLQGYRDPLATGRSCFSCDNCVVLLPSAVTVHSNPSCHWVLSTRTQLFHLKFLQAWWHPACHDAVTVCKSHADMRWAWDLRLRGVIKTLWRQAGLVFLVIIVWYSCPQQLQYIQTPHSVERWALHREHHGSSFHYVSLMLICIEYGTYISKLLSIPFSARQLFISSSSTCNFILTWCAQEQQVWARTLANMFYWRRTLSMLLRLPTLFLAMRCSHIMTNLGLPTFARRLVETPHAIECWALECHASFAISSSYKYNWPSHHWLLWGCNSCYLSCYMRWVWDRHLQAVIHPLWCQATLSPGGYNTLQSSHHWALSTACTMSW